MLRLCIKDILSCIYRTIRSYILKIIGYCIVSRFNCTLEEDIPNEPHIIYIKKQILVPFGKHSHLFGEDIFSVGTEYAVTLRIMRHSVIQITVIGFLLIARAIF